MEFTCREEKEFSLYLSEFLTIKKDPCNKDVTKKKRNRSLLTWEITKWKWVAQRDGLDSGL